MVFDITQLKKIRKQLNLTQNQLSRYANVSQSLIAKIESNKLDPTYSKVKLLEEAISKLTKKEELEAKDIMTKNVIVAKPEDKIRDAIKLMNKHAVSQLPILNKESIMGLISESNIVENSNDINKLHVGDIMEEATPSISINSKLSVITSLLKFYPSILVTEKGKLKGIITKSDLIRSLV